MTDGTSPDTTGYQPPPGPPETSWPNTDEATYGIYVGNKDNLDLDPGWHLVLPALGRREAATPERQLLFPAQEGHPYAIIIEHPDTPTVCEVFVVNPLKDTVQVTRVTDYLKEAGHGAIDQSPHTMWELSKNSTPGTGITSMEPIMTTDPQNNRPVSDDRFPMPPDPDIQRVAFSAGRVTKVNADGKPQDLGLLRIHNTGQNVTAIELHPEAWNSDEGKTDYISVNGIRTPLPEVVKKLAKIANRLTTLGIQEKISNSPTVSSDLHGYVQLRSVQLTDN